MTTLDDLRDVLPSETLQAWPAVADSIPDDGILMGGTALTVHLHHRVSRDLDVFTSHDFDVDATIAALRRHGAFAVTQSGDGTLNGVFEQTKVQVLWARDQQILEPPDLVSGLAVGSISDILATKVKVIADRGELRDYYDLRAIETIAHRPFEEGLRLYLTRFGTDPTHNSITAIVNAIGYLDDVADDPFLEATDGPDLKAALTRYWTKRQPAIVQSLDTR